MALFLKHPIKAGIALILLGCLVSTICLWFFSTDEVVPQMIGLPFMVPGVLLIMVSRVHRSSL